MTKARSACPSMCFVAPRERENIYFAKVPTPFWTLPIMELRSMMLSLVPIMNDVHEKEAGQSVSGSRADKRALAAYYRVGLRTIEKWFY